MIALPKGITHAIFHNEHRCSYMTVEEYFHYNEYDEEDLSVEDRAECVRNDEVWELVWYPDTPVGQFRVVGPTLERVLQLANG